ncbi:methyltransferase type 12 [Caballeronia udeis]|uniref:Methyltransferase type 12 n=1 Tax=Caballeronia udeis TaxID=1232866 RepID=A0A158F2D9_9BURK|nr:class I SAM-dependent methyltransferase [Caballeronia udeis]SAL14008.1 methyltransferase type 12 [Caballeronia udeis]
MKKPVNFDEYTETYNSLLTQQTRFFASGEEYFSHYKVAIVRDEVKSPPARILEFGCGIGRNIRYLRDAFPDAEIMGSDISAKSLEMARSENEGVRFWCEGVDEQPDNQQFDLIFVAGVFHHIPPAQRADVATTLFSRLTPGGSLFVFEHNPFNPVTRRIVDNCPYDEDAVLLTPRNLSNVLRQGGLRVERQAFALFFPPRLKALLGLEPFLGWLPLGGQYWVKATR